MISQREIGLNAYLKFGLMASLAVHIVLALLLNAPPRAPISSRPLVFDVVFERPEQKLPEERPPSEVKRQIVLPPAKSEEQDTGTRKLLSDMDSNAKREQIKRGIDPRAGQQASAEKKAAPGAKAAAASSQRKPAPPAERKTLKQLSLDPQTMLQKFSGPSAKSSAQDLDQALQAEEPLAAAGGGSYRPFSRPMGSGAAFLGMSGSPDYLPNLPDGDITLLNTKASLHAVFVRRVATLVFSELRAQGWESLRPADIRGLTSPSVVRAILSPDGRLLRAQLESSSSSPRFDEILQAAVQKGARDSNPPKEAATADGNFHFVFEAKSWSRPAYSPRTGAPTERRWLLLATGLE